MIPNQILNTDSHTSAVADASKNTNLTFEDWHAKHWTCSIVPVFSLLSEILQILLVLTAWN